MATGAMDKLDQLDKVEKEIVSCLYTAGQALAEIAKDKPSQKQIDLLVTQFMNSLATIDSSLTDHIRYLSQVSTGQPHEGSSYASQKVLQMAWHRLEHARTRVDVLERLKSQHATRLITPAQRQALLQQQQLQQQQQQQESQGGGAAASGGTTSSSTPSTTTTTTTS